MTDQAPPTLTPVTESWERALAVVAHPDDMEFGAAAAVARWTGQGKHVSYCMVTSGEAGIDGMEPAQTAEVREAEQLASARIVGVDEVDFLRLHDGVLEYGVGLRREIARAVRRHRPEIVITNNFSETWDGARMLNMADHIATGRATLDAVRDAGNRWVFHEQLSDEGLEPWGGVRQVWAAASPSSRHGVDVTDSFTAGVESLKAPGCTHRQCTRTAPNEGGSGLCRFVRVRRCAQMSGADVTRVLRAGSVRLRLGYFGPDLAGIDLGADRGRRNCPVVGVVSGVGRLSVNDGAAAAVTTRAAAAGATGDACSVTVAAAADAAPVAGRVAFDGSGGGWSPKEHARNEGGGARAHDRRLAHRPTDASPGSRWYGLDVEFAGRRRLSDCGHGSLPFAG